MIIKISFNSMMMHILILSCASCSVFTPTLDNCNRLYNQGRYSDYIDKCSSIGMGDAVSQYQLYQIYKNGLGGGIDLIKSNYFLQQSASLGYIPAMMETCKGYYTGSIGLQDYERALWWCNKAYQRGMTEANSYLANLYYKQKQYSVALSYFLKQENKSPQGEYIIGILYLQTNKSPENGWSWIRKAYKHKNSDAKLFVSKLNKNYGKCSIEDVYFGSSLSYTEAIKVCHDVNKGNFSAAVAIMHTKRFLRSVF